MPLTSLLGGSLSELDNIILGGVGGSPPNVVSTGVTVGTTFTPNASIAAFVSTGVQVGTTLQVQPTFRTQVRVGTVMKNQSVYTSTLSKVKIATYFVAYSGALASGRWRH